MRRRFPRSPAANRAPRLIRGAWGALLLADPGLPLRVGGGLDSPGVRWAVRLLGARHVAEALILGPAPSFRRWILAADALHGTSMLILAGVSPQLRRDALLSATSASGLVAMTVAEGSGDSRGRGRG